MGEKIDRLIPEMPPEPDESDILMLSVTDPDWETGNDEWVALARTPGGREGDDSPFSTSKTSNWVAKAGGLPKYIREVAHAMVRKGKTESQAIRMAIGIVRNWAEGKGKGTSPAVKAAAVKAIAEWEAKRAKAKADNK